MHSVAHFLAHPALLRHAAKGVEFAAKHAPAVGKFAFQVVKRVAVG